MKFFFILSLFSLSLPLSVFAKPIFIGKQEQKPMEVALTFLHDDLPSGDAEGKELLTIQQSRIFCEDQQKNCPLQSKIIFTIDGLNDDSIMKQRHILILQQDANQTWEIIKKDTTQTCRKGRGHNNFSHALCR